MVVRFKGRVPTNYIGILDLSWSSHIQEILYYGLVLEETMC